MSKYDYVIVGAGLYGSVFAHQATKKGKKCLVIDRRNHIGGNCYTENIEGINVHKYGAHIFHTSNKEVWDFVNSLVEFHPFTLSPIANFEGELYNLPFNMNTFYKLWGTKTPAEAKAKIEEQKKEFVHIKDPQNLEEQALILGGKDIYEKLIKGYVSKQWGRPATEVPAFIIRRLPFRFNFDNNYFNDTYQGIPIGGYTKLFEKLLEGIDVKLGINYFDEKEKWDSLANKVLYTGPIDEFFNFRFGKLDYRSLIFENEILNIANYQGNSVVSYTESKVPYTRIIEHKHFEMFGDEVEKNTKTIITKEFSTEWKEGMEPYYPINDEENNKLYQKYKELADADDKYIFGGRLAEYKYYDMAPVVELVLKRFSKL